MQITRRSFLRTLSAAAAAGAVGSVPALSSTTGSYRAMVGVFLYGGNDGWNMIVPTDYRYASYASARGSVALKQAALTPLAGSPFALHPAMSALAPVWQQGALGLVLNTGTLNAPLTKAQYQSRPDLRPLNLMSHSAEQEHWHSMRTGTSSDGFMGRVNDRAAGSAVPSLVSVHGSNLALLGSRSSPLILPESGLLTKSGNTQNSATLAAIDAFSGGAGSGAITEATGSRLATDYGLATQTNSVLGRSSTVDSYFVHSVTGQALDTVMSRQLLRVARMIEARESLGHARQTFFVGQEGYDMHSAQVDSDTSKGLHATMLGEMAEAFAAFNRAMKGLGLDENVTLFTLSDFGRTYKGNAQLGTDHAWGNNHIVLGGGLTPFSLHGTYPAPTLGGPDDIDNNGRFIPTLSAEEYVGAIAQWHGVAASDMGYVFPNWSTWSTNGRGPLGLFK
jgi:uncharacterized protein (DUF1501 family)